MKKIFVPALAAALTFSIQQTSNEKIYRRFFVQHEEIIKKEEKKNIEKFEYELAKKIYQSNIKEKISSYAEQLVKNGKISPFQAELLKRSAHLWPLIKFHAKRIDPDPSLPYFHYVLASVENDFLDKTSPAGALGKFQLMPHTAKWLLKIKDPYIDPRGIKYSNGKITWISDENSIILSLYFVKFLKEKLGKNYDEGCFEIYNSYVCGFGNKDFKKTKHLIRFYKRLEDLKLTDYIEEFLKSNSS